MKQQLILQSLLEGKRLTTLDGMLKFKTTELRKRVSELRRLGYPIADKWIVNKKTNSRYKEYFI